MEVTIKGEKKLRDLIQEYQKRLGDLSTPLAEFGEYKLRVLREQWDREETPDGKSWKPLAPATVEEKRRNNKMPGILVQDLNLRDRSFSYKANTSGMKFGTNAKYAPKHQLGLGNVPKREFLGVNNEDIQELLETFMSYLQTR